MKRAVLVRPEGPRNVGMALRAAANFGPLELVVVGPVRPSLLVHPEFEQMAHGVEDMAERVRICASLDEALADVTWSVGFTARARGHWKLRDWRDARAEVAARANDPGEVFAFVFGNEVTGLSGEDCSRCQELVRIPTSEEHGSLNLAMAVSIALCECYAGSAGKLDTQRGEPLTGGDREYLRMHVKEVLSGLARTESYRQDIEASVDRVFRRAPLETRDARAWHGIMRAMGNHKTPADFGL